MGHKLPGSDSDASRAAHFRRGSRHANEARLRSPSTRSESQVSTARSVVSNPNANSKSITYNETINPADRINFETDVDELMKVIQEKEDQDQSARTQASTPAQTPTAESGPQSPVSTAHSSTSRAEPKPKKKWVCNGSSCNKRFVQKTHLDIHRRTHTGAKPYVCTKDNCGLTFSQRGNLKTHMRRHTGEKPFSCSICGKLFAQCGNVCSHEETHKGLKPYICRLDDCNKTFSQLGNMKTHQNNFHKETLQRLTEMFLKFARMGEVPEEHQELFEYFRVHYKNSNKGIKGRGKARTVAPKTKGGSQAPSSMAFPHLPMPTQQPAYVPGPSHSLSAASHVTIPRPTAACSSSTTAAAAAPAFSTRTSTRDRWPSRPIACTDRRNTLFYDETTALRELTVKDCQLLRSGGIFFLILHDTGGKSPLRLVMICRRWSKPKTSPHGDRKRLQFVLFLPAWF